ELRSNGTRQLRRIHTVRGAHLFGNPNEPSGVFRSEPTLSPARTSRDQLPPPTCLFGFRRMCNGEDRMHVFGQRFAKRDGVRRKSAAPVPLNCNSLSDRFAAMGYADNPQSVSIR